MSPATWLGVGAVLLSVAFVLALPGIVEVEPADEVEPIEFGPVPAAGRTEAGKAEKPSRPGSQGRRADQSAAPAKRPALDPSPVVAGDDDTGEGDDDTGEGDDDTGEGDDDAGESSETDDAGESSETDDAGESGEIDDAGESGEIDDAGEGED